MSTGEPTGDRTPPVGWAYYPAIDGLRALAVGVVVVFHYANGLLPGGFVGVDLFFVLSGFLITGMLSSEYTTTGTVDLRSFWGRRIRRLMPAVIVLVAVTQIAVRLTDTGSFRQLAHSIGALTWTTNWIELAGAGSRIWLVDPRTVLDHLWSLAIEEQFYLVWPVLLVGLLRRVSGRGARSGVVVLAIALSAFQMHRVGGVTAYIRTDTRAFELLIGALLSLTGLGVAPHRSRIMSSALMIGGFGGFLAFASIATPTAAWMYPWGFLAVCGCSAAMIVAACRPTEWILRTLANPVIRHLGVLSYGIYLWHIPVLRLATSSRIGVSGVWLRILQVVVAVAAAELSHRFVERPLRVGRIRLGAGRIALAYLLSASTLLLGIGATRNDFEHRWDVIGAPPRVPPGGRKVLLVGDLLGAAIVPPDTAGVWNATDPGCGFARTPGSGVVPVDAGRPRLEDEACRHWQRRWRNAVDAWSPDVVVIAAGYWDSLELRATDRTLEGAELDRRYRRLVRSQVDAVRDGTGAPRPVVLVRLDDWSLLIDDHQRDRADRLRALAAYDRAIAAVASTPAVSVATISGRPAWNELGEEWSRLADDLPG